MAGIGATEEASLAKTEQEEEKRGRKRKRSCRRITAKTEAADEEYEVECILNHRFEIESLNQKYNLVKYLVKWKDWNDDANTWERFENLINSLETVVLYYESKYEVRTGPAALRSFRQKLLNFDEKDLQDLLPNFITQSGDIFPEIDIEDLKNRTELIGRLPTFAREKRIMDQLKLDYMTLEIKKRRKYQLRNLLEWEEEMNASNVGQAPIRIENKVDLEVCPPNFKCINKYLACFGGEIPSDPLIGCHCQPCGAYSKCFCVEQVGRLIPYSKGLLRVTRGTPIYECNKKCDCDSTCPNRVLQKGRKVPLKIFRTSNGCGWGVKTLENIPKGKFVTEYVGEVISSKEAERRGRQYDREGRTYLFDLDFNVGSDKNAPCKYTVDAAEYGNVSHFINHSCSPNLEVFAVWVNCLDPDIPHLGLFASRNIKANEEITFDYLCQPVSTPRAKDDQLCYCRCNAANCRVYLY